MSSSFRRLFLSFVLSAVVGFFPLIGLWNSNLGQVPASAVTGNLLYTFVYVLIVYGLCFLLTRSPEKSAVLSSVTTVFVFSFGHLVNLVGDANIFGFSIGFLKLLLVWGVLYAVLSFWIIRIKHIPNLSFLIVPLGTLTLFNFAAIAAFFVQNQAPAAQPVAANASNQAASQDLPDIYYIVLDAYARDDILQEVIGYDNTAFLSALRERGFYLPDCAFSNYDGTVGTVMSVLNYEMLQNLNVPTDSSGAYQISNYNLIYNNQASKVFRAYGYQFVTGRGFAPFNDIADSDVYLNYAIEKGIEDDLAEKRFTSLYFNTTIFRVISELYKNNPANFPQIPVWLAIDPHSEASLTEANFWYLQNNYMFDSLEEIPEKPGSHFVYAHINAPHGPYVYRRDGSFRYPLDDQAEKVLYADAIDYINGRVLEVVDALLEKSTPAPIIILQGDHSIHMMTAGVDKHKILSAYYLPGELSTPPYEHITPVNNFRLILKNYFDPSVQLLPDTLWVKRINNYEPVAAGCSLDQ